MKVDQEILYVQKLYFFFFLMSVCLAIGLLIVVHYGQKAGLIFILCSTLVSYLVMLSKKSFPPPERKTTVQRMAREISKNTDPLTIARFASQLYFYLHESEHAISLLEQFLSTNDPLLTATLGDILLKEGKPRKALSILRSNPFLFSDPLLLATQGHVLKSLGKIPEAAKMYERALSLAKTKGFPHNGAPLITQKLLTLSYTAHIHHALAECYTSMENPTLAKRHYWSGNRRLLDISLWRYPKKTALKHLQRYKKIH